MEGGLGGGTRERDKIVGSIRVAHEKLRKRGSRSFCAYFRPTSVKAGHEHQSGSPCSAVQRCRRLPDSAGGYSCF